MAHFLPILVIDDFISLNDHEKQCSCSSHSLHKIGEDRSEKLEFTPAILKVLEYVRPKYACRQCEKTKDNSSIVQKPAPQSIIPKSFATESLLANIILGKYQYAMPLYRQESLFTQSGIELSRTTMARWVIQVSEKFKSLYKALKEHLLEQVAVHADETPLSVLKEDKQCYMWLYCSGADSPEATLSGMKNIVLFDYQNSRARACPVDFLGDYSGYLQSDGYGAYDGLTKVTNVGCFAHARRKFMDAKKLQGKGKSGKADVALAKIQKLYALESRLKLASNEERWSDTYALRENVINYISKYREYGIHIPDGGSSMLTINYCPWCGAKLPNDLRDIWFDIIFDMGLEPDEDPIPDIYTSEEWWKIRGL